MLPGLEVDPPPTSSLFGASVDIVSSLSIFPHYKPTCKALSSFQANCPFVGLKGTPSIQAQLDRMLGRQGGIEAGT